jgi:hypothetical protein
MLYLDHTQTERGNEMAERLMENRMDSCPNNIVLELVESLELLIAIYGDDDNEATDQARDALMKFHDFYSPDA